VVGYGIIHGDFKTQLPKFTPPGNLGSLRQLKSFMPMSRAPKSLQLIRVLHHTIALRELIPTRSPAEKDVCKYLLAGFASSSASSSFGTTQAKAKSSNVTQLLPPPDELEYEVRTQAGSIRARLIEAKLVGDYQAWLRRQDHHRSDLTRLAIQHPHNRRLMVVLADALAALQVHVLWLAAQKAFIGLYRAAVKLDGLHVPQDQAATL
jgi:hypothetical protein